MNRTEIDPQDCRFSTDDWPEPERRRAVWDLHGRTIWPSEFELSADGPIYIDGRYRVVPGLGVADITCSGTRRVRRTREHLSDDYVLGIVLSGRGTAWQRGREVTIGYGEAALTSGTMPGESAVSGSRFLGFRVPRSAIAPLVPDIDDHVARIINRETPALQLLAGYSSMFCDSRVIATPAARQLAVKTVYDLVALALGPSRDAAEVVNARGVRAARLREIKADIAANIAQEDLSVATVAARHRLPVRYVQRLFEEDGATLTQFVLERRLARAREILVNRRLAHFKMSMVAIEAGFSNMSYFYQSFRRRYGASPSDLRAEMRRAN